MKKLFTLLLSASLLCALSACSGETSSSSDNSISETSADSFEQTLQSSESSIETEESTDLLDSTEDAGGTLIAYFSWSGNTEQVAQIIQTETGGDLFEIATAEPYTDDYDELLDIAQQEQADDARPELADLVDNWDSYDVIFVGYPNWWNDAPMAVYTFLESYDFTDKTLIPFNTSASSGFGRSLAGIEESASSANILGGLAITEGNLSNAQSEVTDWLDGLNLG